jgi:hypothetical protein
MHGTTIKNKKTISNSIVIVTYEISYNILPISPLLRYIYADVRKLKIIAEICNMR